MNVLQLQFNFVFDNNRYTLHETSEYKIADGIVFQVRVVCVPIAHTNHYLNKFYIRGQNVAGARSKTFKIESAQSSIKTCLLDVGTDPTWHLIGAFYSVYDTLIEFNIELEKNTPASSFASLYDDTNLTDFELRGDDGSVGVHRAVLAASSPVLRTMFEGAWKETTDGGVKIPNTSRATLQLLKQYLYLNILPEEEGLENLLLLASCYMIDDLKEECIHLLVSTLTAENILNRMEFAVQNAMRKLQVMTLKRVHAGHIKVDDIRLE